MFAVVAAGLEDDRVLCCLRYQQTPSGWQKLNTEQAHALLADHYPEYLFYSILRDTACHAVPLARIHLHIHPQQRLQALLLTQPTDPVLRTCIDLLHQLQAHDIDISAMGITGSLLIGAQHPTSDIDLVFYDRVVFQNCRQLLPYLFAQQHLQPLGDDDWQTTYLRRACELTFADYVWHERRKANKAVLNGRKIDLSFVNRTEPLEQTPYQKIGAVTRTLQVSDDRLAYDYPAVFKVTDAELECVICFTATYTGQAVTGEWIEVAGQLEATQNGLKRLVVGASREAKNEYIKVIATHD